jgi:tetratricopeptide (TPR) repeat protein
LKLEPLSQSEAVALLNAWQEETVTGEVAKEICEAVGRLPLAVRIAGRYLEETGETAEDYLEWLELSPIKALSHGDHREESVHVLLRLSVAQVSDLARQALTVVGQLALAPFGVEPIAAALELPLRKARTDGLSPLVSYGLLERLDESYLVSHALVHSYASRRLGVKPGTAARLVAFYIALAQAESKIGVEGYRRLDREQLHLMRVLQGCVKRETWDEARRLVVAVQDYLEIQGHWTEWVETLQAGLEAARRLDRPRDLGRFLANLGNAYRNLGQVTPALDLYQQSLATARTIGDRRGEGANLTNLGNAYRDLGQVEWAIDFYQQALAIAREIDDRRGEGADLANLGSAYRDLGQVERAIGFYQQSLAIAQEIDDRRGEGTDLANLGNAYRDLGQVERAIDFYQRSLAIAQEIGDRRGEGYRLGNLGLAYSDLGQLEKAIDFYRRSLDIVREIGDRRGEGAFLGNLGLAYSAQRQVEKAIEYHEQSLAIAQEIGDRHGEGKSLGNLGMAYSDLGQPAQAIDFFRQSLIIAKEIGDRRGEAFVSWHLGLLYEESEPERAVEFMSVSVAYAEEIGLPDARQDAERVAGIRVRIEEE